MAGIAGTGRSIPLMGRESEPTIFELSAPGRHAATFRTTNLPEWSAEELVPEEFLRDDLLDVAEVSERDLVGHVTRLTHRQYSVDLGAYPLGSCTMKYNPKLCDEAAGLAGFGMVHPSTPAEYSQGWLELLVELETRLCAVTGMAAATLQPPAGAAGELTGLLLMRAWHNENGSGPRTKIVIPDSAHGTNPASVTLGGYETVTVPSDDRGCVDLAALRERLDTDVAGIMLTNPNTLGLVRGGHHRDRPHDPRGRRSALLRRRQPQCHPRRHSPGRHGLRHRAHEPAQDLRRAPRRGRARSWAGRSR